MPQGGDVESLSEPLELAAFDLSRNAPAQGRQNVAFRVTREGVAEGVMRWIRLDFGAGIVFESRPPQPSAWSPVLHVLPQPRPVRAGQTVSLEVAHTRDRLFLIPGE